MEYGDNYDPGSLLLYYYFLGAMVSAIVASNSYTGRGPPAPDLPPIRCQPVVLLHLEAWCNRRAVTVYSAAIH